MQPQSKELLTLRAEMDQLNARIHSLEKIFVNLSDSLMQTQKTVLAMHKTIGLLVEAVDSEPERRK